MEPWANFWLAGLASLHNVIRRHGILLAVLLVSMMLRVVLASHGGQGYFPDESRYKLAVDTAETIAKGDWSTAMRATFSRADHLGFRIVMTIPAFGQLAWGWSLVTIAELGSGLFSVVGILLTYGIARRLGAEQDEAGWTVVIMAVTNCLFYWSRHIMPYDMALCMALGCLFVGVHPEFRWHRSIIVGFLGFWAFITYNGYWTMVAFALGIHVLIGWPSIKQCVLRGLFGFVGFGGSLRALLNWADGRGYGLTDSYYQFSESINQGDFADGHRVILEYLWYSERGLLIVWLLCVGWFVVHVLLRQSANARRGWLGLAGVVTICWSLISYSVGEERFVVYGRLVRQVAPFFALLSGAVLADICARYSRWKWFHATVALVVIGLGGANLSVPLRQRWDFREQAEKYRDEYRRSSGATEAERIPANRFQFVEQGFIWPLPKKFDLPPHVVLFRRDHVLQFQALLYEGFNREQRAAIRGTDISSQLILLQP